jgi:hypothetical protein
MHRIDDDDNDNDNDHGNGNGNDNNDKEFVAGVAAAAGGVGSIRRRPTIDEEWKQVMICAWLFPILFLWCL